MYSYSSQVRSNKVILVKDMIEKHLGAEYLDEENAYYCDFCKENCQAMRCISIKCAPKLLVIQFKRYKVHRITFERQKIFTMIDCPLVLDIPRNICYDGNNEYIKYLLFGCVIHDGRSISSGHFYSIGRHAAIALQFYNIQKDSSGGKWYKFNDNRVTNFSYLELQKLIGCHGQTPYMLLYVRVK